jgi:hydroxymethylbilane synthase
MKRKNEIIVGTRGSRLAVIQTEAVVGELAKANPGYHFDLVKIATAGDRHRKASLWDFGEIGIFVKELEEALQDGRIDIAVHSLKDMPTEVTLGLTIAAVTQRCDPRDVLVSPHGSLSDLPAGARVGTGSPRRAVQLLAQRPDIEVLPLRGNIDTRLKKMSPMELDGILLAAAAMIRLGMESRITEYLSPDAFVPAAGQGAVAIEVRADDEAMLQMASCVNHDCSWTEVTAERAFLRALGGGCREPIAALGSASGEKLRLVGMVASSTSGEILRAEVSGAVSNPESVGAQLARDMMSLGACSLIGRSVS